MDYMEQSLRNLDQAHKNLLDAIRMNRKSAELIAALLNQVEKKTIQDNEPFPVKAAKMKYDRRKSKVYTIEEGVQRALFTVIPN